MKNQKNKVFAIGIPTINRADLLIPTLARYKQDFPGTLIFVVDNGCQSFPILNEFVTIYPTPTNVGVAASWNFLAQQAFLLHDLPFLWLLNDDVYSGKKENQILDLFNFNEGEQFFCSPGSLSSFIIGRDLFKKIGPFDEQFFPAYFEDNDYLYRMKLAGCNKRVTSWLSCEEYRNSSSIEKDPSLNRRFDTNKQYYLAKWGGLPEYEKFKTPFNKPLP